MTYDLIYEKKNKAPDYFTDQVDVEMKKMHIKDEDLIIDLRIGNNKEFLANLFEANRQNVAISNENTRLARNKNIREDVYGKIEARDLATAPK